ncbi:GNAT family N-acetyltransferase [Oceanicella actignis]|uniref:GNAT family N-acetyltransferase n=1 Tax=Oceanicella actignis TaxID=1189325 RepID=UPI0011E64E81|nr:GNAT family N-acetyltransferase [Oceanicella actignis]TYO89539.1 hypothetical protein LY05_01528 [Oceanicella actignis]
MNAPGEGFVATLLEGVGALPAREWDACAEAAAGGRPADPFVTHRFLKALEDSGSVGPGTGWTPAHLTLRPAGRDDAPPLAVMPLYVKSHSFGEYVFDHAWADAYERAGGRYYPKLQSAVPFTPVGGRRLLTGAHAPPEAAPALLRAAARVAERAGLSSLHVTFCTEDEARLAEGLGMLPRMGEQFHWFNRGYGGFDDFLAALSSRKRKQIRRERREGAEGLRIRRLTGEDIRPEHWDAFWRFYQDTGARKWGRPYLTRAFFEEAHAHLRDDILLILAEREGRPIAGALNFIGREALFGRWWGCLERRPFLHFELCYHQAVEAAIEMGLSRVEAGAQGEHKLARGYEPRPTWSAHWVADPGFRAALDDYLAAERAAVAREIAWAGARAPYRKDAPGAESQEDRDDSSA